MRWFGLIVVVTLNIAMTGSNFRLRASGRLDLAHELLSYFFLAFLDAVFLLPTILEVNSVIVTPHELILSPLLWRVVLPWEKILWCKKPVFLAYAIVKTRRCFYLINKRDIPEFDQLLETITARLKSVRQCISP